MPSFIEFAGCTVSACLNGGVCVNGTNGSFCSCALGYRGQYCGTSKLQSLFYNQHAHLLARSHTLHNSLLFIPPMILSTSNFSLKFLCSNLNILSPQWTLKLSKMKLACFLHRCVCTNTIHPTALTDPLLPSS